MGERNLEEGINPLQTNHLTLRLSKWAWFASTESTSLKLGWSLLEVRYTISLKIKSRHKFLEQNKGKYNHRIK